MRKLKLWWRPVPSRDALTVGCTLECAKASYLEHQGLDLDFPYLRPKQRASISLLPPISIGVYLLFFVSQFVSGKRLFDVISCRQFKLNIMHHRIIASSLELKGR